MATQEEVTAAAHVHRGAKKFLLSRLAETASKKLHYLIERPNIHALIWQVSNSRINLLVYRSVDRFTHLGLRYPFVVGRSRCKMAIIQRVQLWRSHGHKQNGERRSAEVVRLGPTAATTQLSFSGPATLWRHTMERLRLVVAPTPRSASRDLGPPLSTGPASGSLITLS